MFAKLYTGPPEFSDALRIEDSVVKVENGRISLSFSRPLVGGTYNVTMLEPYNDILWAAGEAVDGTPQYHSNARVLHGQMRSVHARSRDQHKPLAAQSRAEVGCGRLGDVTKL